MAGQPGPDPVLSVNDRNLASTVCIRVPTKVAGGLAIPFQFPPRVTSDTKSSSWVTSETASYEPVKIYHGSEPRKLQIEFEYIATGKVYDPKRIAKIVRDIKSYFYEADARGQFTEYPVLIIERLYKIVELGPGKPPTFRLMDFSASFGETLVGNPPDVWPLHTKIAMTLELVTQIAGGIVGEQGKILKAENLPKQPQIEWW